MRTAVHEATRAMDGGRLVALIGELAGYGALGEGLGIDRQALTKEDLSARRFLVERARSLGAEPVRDEAGNFFFRWAGVTDEPPVVTGSHLDSQPEGGSLDGAFGVCAAMEVIAALSLTGYRPRRGVEVVIWANEEGCRFSPGTMGSSVFTKPELLEGFLCAVDADGVTFGAALSSLAAEFADVPLRPLGVPFGALVEAHIEQGSKLEKAGVPIGVVEGIQGARWFSFVTRGRAAHAGTTSRADKHDALEAAVEVASGIYEILEGAADDLRLTIGRLEVRPGSVNVVPGEVRFSVDLRHPDPSTLDAVELELRELARPRVGCEMEVERTMDMSPVGFHPEVISAIASSSDRLQLSYLRLASGAFHDSGRLTEHCPTGMVFVPSIDGISHNPSERTRDEDLADGARTLCEAVVTLADRDPSEPGTVASKVGPC